MTARSFWTAPSQFVQALLSQTVILSIRVSPVMRSFIKQENMRCNGSGHSYGMSSGLRSSIRTMFMSVTSATAMRRLGSRLA